MQRLLVKEAGRSMPKKERRCLRSNVEDLSSPFDPSDFGHSGGGIHTVKTRRVPRNPRPCIRPPRLLLTADGKPEDWCERPPPATRCRESTDLQESSLRRGSNEVSRGPWLERSSTGGRSSWKPGAGHRNLHGLSQQLCVSCAWVYVEVLCAGLWEGKEASQKRPCEASPKMCTICIIYIGVGDLEWCLIFFF